MKKLTDKVWHQLPVEQVVPFLGVNCSTGLSAPEAAQRLKTDRPNELKEGKRISAFHIFPGHPVGWRHDRACARENFHRALPVLRGKEWKWK